MKNMKRSIRRHHYSRLKNKHRNQMKFTFWYMPDEFRDIRACKMISTPCACSCHMCGNPRKYFKELTMQERRENISFKEQIGDVV